MSSVFYISIIPESGIINGVCELKGEVDDPNYRRVDSLDDSLVGKHYNDETGEITFVQQQQYQKVMDSKTFMLLLTRAEMKALQESTNEIIQDTYHLFEMRNGEVNTESDIFQEVMDAAVSAGILTQERADELSLGTPYQYV